MRPDNLEEKQSEMIARNQEKKSKKKASRPKKEKLPRRSRASLPTLIREAVINSKTSSKDRIILLHWLAKIGGTDLPLPVEFWKARDDESEPTKPAPTNFRLHVPEGPGRQALSVD